MGHDPLLAFPAIFMVLSFNLTFCLKFLTPPSCSKFQCLLCKLSYKPFLNYVTKYLIILTLLLLKKIVIKVLFVFKLQDFIHQNFKLSPLKSSWRHISHNFGSLCQFQQSLIENFSKSSKLKISLRFSRQHEEFQLSCKNSFSPPKCFRKVAILNFAY